MKSLIIYAHPGTDGHNRHILRTVTEYHKQNSLEYEVLDLYRMKYDPVLKFEEHYTAGNRHVSAQNKKIQEKFKSSRLIFIYPTWWYGPPAVLKGLLERVLIPGYAFRYSGRIPKGLLSNKALVFTTTGGPTWFYRLLSNLPAGNIKATLGFCGVRTRVVQVGDARRLRDRKSLSARVRRALAKFI